MSRTLPPKLTAAQRKHFAARALAWYQTHKRDLPWRREAHDPYRVWIAEILLQQTQVAAVLPYYERFVARFPTLRALARAKLDDVLKTWEGAGYYARARNLHRAAREMVNRYGGQVPRTVDELLTLPGIGRYTAGAIASIAFDAAVPILDGNVTRVFCRYFDVRQNPKESGVQRVLWELAATLVPHKLAGNYNQALMDIGATICTPRRPACALCPLKRGCTAQRLGLQEQLPAKRSKRPLPHHDVAVGVIWKNGLVLIAKRFPRALLGGLWEFPGGHRKKSESLPACVKREVLEELGIKVAVGQEIAVVEHAYSHFSITMHAFRCKYIGGRPRALGCADWKWVSPRALSRYAFPKANRKILESIGVWA